MLIEKTLFGEIDKVQIAIDRIRNFEPEEGYWLGFSGGKDSVVVKHLLIISGVKFDAHYRHVGFDPPELIRYIRKHHSDVPIELPKVSQWTRMSKTGPASRRMRWCCDHKESGGKGRLVVTGVRWEESIRRSQRRMVELCYADNSKSFFHPIIDWSEQEVWEYIHSREIHYCELYDEGWKRLGCVMCPLTTMEQRQKEAERWPKYANNYLKMCEKAFKRKKELQHKMPKQWTSGKDMFDWFMTGKATENADPDQTVFFLE